MKYETHDNIDENVDEDYLYKIDKISLDYKYWHKRAIESEIKNIYDIKRPNGMSFIHENEVNRVSECNLINDMLSPSKHTNF